MGNTDWKGIKLIKFFAQSLRNCVSWASCHCNQDAGHPAWSFTYMVDGKKRVQHIPKELVSEIQQRVAAGREYQDAVRREVLAANAQLWALAQKQKPRR